MCLDEEVTGYAPNPSSKFKDDLHATIGHNFIVVWNVGAVDVYIDRISVLDAQPSELHINTPNIKATILTN